MRVILGPGLAPGLAGIGVLMELEEHHITVDEVIGVNTGALIAALWATENDFLMCADVLSHLPWDKFAVATSLGRSDPLLNTLQLLTRHATFEEIRRKTAVVARNRHNGQVVLLRDDSIAQAVRGSMAVPGLFHPPGKKHEMDFVDAGALWWQVIAAESQFYDTAVCVLPNYANIAEKRREHSRETDLTFSDGMEELAYYIGLNWSCTPDCGSSILVEPVGGMLSFDQAEKWLMAGRVATRNWLLGIKDLSL